MKLKILVLGLIFTCSMISPVLAQDSLPSLQQSELNRRMRDEQSLNAQAQYNAYHANSSASQMSPLDMVMGIGGGVFIFGVFYGLNKLRHK